MDQDQETLGPYLKRERESHLVPVEEIALSLGVNRSFIDALEGGDFDIFPGRSECLRLLKKYAAYLKLNQAEVFKLFDAEWNLASGVKRYPKLTQFADGDASRVRSVLFTMRKLRVGHLPAGWIWLSVIAGALIVTAVLFIDLPDAKRELASPDHRPQSGTAIEIRPAGDRVPPPAAGTEEQTASPKQIARSQAPLLRPGVAEGKPAPQPAGSRVIGNRDSKRYHLPGMKYYDQVKTYHRVVFPSEKEAVRAGYRKARE